MGFIFLKLSLLLCSLDIAVSHSLAFPLPTHNDLLPPPAQSAGSLFSGLLHAELMMPTAMTAAMAVPDCLSSSSVPLPHNVLPATGELHSAQGVRGR